MSERYPGGIITKSPATPTGPYQTGTAPGIWTLEQQLQFQQQGVWPTAGLTPNYIEDVFSTWLYTGTGATQTITNNIDLSTKGGLVWLKERNNARSHFLQDSARTITSYLSSDNTDAASSGTAVTALNTTGFTLGTQSGSNGSGNTYVSWSFRKQPKFFDVVTYTGTGTTAQNINHNLGSVPGCIIIKRTNSTSDWGVVHRSTNAYANYGYIGGKLNTTGVVGQTVAQDTGIYYDNSTYFTVDEGSAYFNPNASGGTYVAYLFAHNAGGFGLTGTDNVISCGSFTASSGAATVTLGYEPQWIMFKRTDSSTGGNWYMVDVMRGWSFSAVAELSANTSNAEDPNAFVANPTATGFSFGTGTLTASGSYIYIAIRRGPMAVPTDGTKVFSPFVGSDTSTITTGFPVDMFLDNKRAGNSNNTVNGSRLVGVDALRTASTAAETAGLIGGANCWQNNTGYLPNALGTGIVAYALQRAPSFMDVVCYTGNGAGANNQTHNLGVQPEMCILRRRNSTVNWQVVHKNDGTTAVSLGLNVTNATIVTSVMSANFTSTYFKTADGTCWFEGTNGNTFPFVAYLFATCAGVSKVGSYTGTGATQTIDCGFGAGGARFVLVKRTDTTGDWYVWDTARGMVSGTDPSLLLNSIAAEVNANSIYTIATGFQIVSTAAGINASGGNYIFLAIA